MKPWLSALVACVVGLTALTAAEAAEVVEDAQPVRGTDDPATSPRGVDGTQGDGPGDDLQVLPEDHRVLVAEARKLAAVGERSRALELLDNYLSVYPNDVDAKVLRLNLRIAEQQEELGATISARVDEKGFVLGDPAYEEAKARSPIRISRQLDLVEFLIQKQKFTEAVEMCQRIKDNHGQDEATLTLLDRLLGYLNNVEKRRLERDRALRRGEVVNEIIEAGTMPRAVAPIPRTVLIFDEDIQAQERERLLQRLRIRVGMIRYDSQPLSVILQDLFALAGLNFVIRDDALGGETLTISLVDETVEHVLEVVQRMVPVAFNYRGGSVYVTSSDSPILVTEIIRLKSGLTDVLTQVEIGQDNNQGDDQDGGGGGGISPFDVGGGQDGQELASDLERFLEAALGEEALIEWPEGSSRYLDHKTNTLYVRSSPAAIAELKRLLNALDYNNVQVLIETRFVLVSDSALDRLGVNWALLGQQEGSGDRQFFVGGAQEAAINPVGINPAGLASNLTSGTEGLRLGMVGIGEDLTPNFSVTIDALEGRGEANVFSEPKILTLNNTTGVIAFQNDIAYVSGFTNQAIGNNNSQVDNGTVVTNSQNVLVPDFETEQEEIRLTVRPSVAQNSDIITLHIHPRIREFVGFAGDTDFANVPSDTAVLGNTPVRQPQFQNRELATTLHIQNGQTIVLGGLVEEQDNRSRSGIPYLSRIPGAGLLFGTRSKELERAKLLIFVTVNIIDPSGAEFTEEVRHLRNAARVSLTDEARAVEKAREELEAQIAAQRAAERVESENASSRSPAAPGPHSQHGGKPRR